MQRSGCLGSHLDRQAFQDGYEEYLEALADPNHERHEEFMEWSGPFDSEPFDAEATTKAMRRGLPHWREME